MDVSQIIGSIRKFGNFLMCLFPFLPRWGERIRQWILPILSRLGLVRFWQTVQSSRRWKALQTALARFYWRDYSKDLHEWEGLPRHGIVLLRVIFVLTVMLAVLLPLAMMWPAPGVWVQGSGEQKVLVAGWSVLLWIASFAFGWGCLLGGASVSNRPALLLAAACFAYLFGATATCLPRSVWNLTLALAIGTAAFVGQRRIPAERGGEAWRGLAFCSLAGMMAGLSVFVFSPLGNGLPGVRLPLGLAAGWVLGLLLWRFSGWRKSPPAAAGEAPAGLSVTTIVLLLSAVCGVFLLSLAGRGGLARLAGSIYPLIGLWSAYLWPVWYFIGIGVIFKLLKHAKILTSTFQELVPLRYLAPLIIFFILGGALLTWSETLTGLPLLVRSTWIERLCTALYHQATPWIWSKPLRSFTADWLKWVFLFDVVALGWLMVVRRLTSELLVSLLFKTFLAWFLIYEYQFEFFSFTRSGTHSATILFLITVWVLWLTHVVGLKFSGRGTAHWPQEGRIPLYGAVLLFVLLNLHARAAMGDSRVVDEVFLSLFRGIVDVGLPYFLYVYAGRQFKELPVPASRLFATFSAGALFTLPLAALDRFVAAGSWRALWADLDARLATLYSGNPVRTLPLSPDLPVTWILIRGILALGVVALLAAWLQRRLADSPAKPAALTFLVMSFATGLASFSKAQLTLPFLTGRVEILLTPFRESTELDANVLAAYFIYSLPALLLVLAVTSRRGNPALRWAAGTLAAFAAYSVAAVLWPAREPWLRSTGLMATAGLAGLGAFLLLILAVRQRIELALAAEKPAGPEAPPAPPPLVGRRARRLIAVGAGIILLWVGADQIRSGWMVPWTVAGLPAPVNVPAIWEVSEAPPAGCLASFRRRSRSPFGTVLRLSVAPCPPGGRKELLRGLMEPMAQNLPGFGIQRVESWDGWFPGAYAVDFYYDQILPDKTDIPIIGTVVLLPGAGGRAMVWTLTSGELSEWEPSRWDQARIARTLRGRW